ncbi:uncharacterized protein ARMOST_08162 [Armillaria ostoyae]|uniref:Glycoside hydrolase family 5 domain-containing protein n=1 Tax=Armillaria ostoyae TaxID=47428 RepID=A0A284R7U4_ARMOS|nr:uncharacterized protein ARMOST_08162 [Armillaria ostoyae]
MTTTYSPRSMRSYICWSAVPFDEHFSGLRRWACTFKAVEHAGLLYSQPSLHAFVALHQAMWLCYSGGSGAPAWTLDAVGFDLHKLEDTGSAWLKGVKGGGHVEEEESLWSCGYSIHKARCGDYGYLRAQAEAQASARRRCICPRILQGAFLDMFENFVRAVGDLEVVIGFEMTNEPHRVYLESQYLHVFDYNTDFHLANMRVYTCWGNKLTRDHLAAAFVSFRLGASHPTEVPVYSRSFPMPTRKNLMHGAWEWDVDRNEAVILRQNYFVKHPMKGQKVDWYDDFFYLFIHKWEQGVRGIVSPEKILFIEVIPNEVFLPRVFLPGKATVEHGLCAALVDGLYNSVSLFADSYHTGMNALFSKAFRDFTVNIHGLSRVRDFSAFVQYLSKPLDARDKYSLQIKNIVEHGYKTLSERPVIIGECSTPVDLNKKETFASDNLLWQTRIMDAMITGLERTLTGESEKNRAVLDGVVIINCTSDSSSSMELRYPVTFSMISVRIFPTPALPASFLKVVKTGVSSDISTLMTAPFLAEDF